MVMSHQFSSGERCSRCSSSRAAGRQSLMPLLAALVKSLISDSFSASPKCASTKKTGSQALSMQCPRPPSKTWHGHLIGTKSETELQPNTAPHIRSYSVNRSRKAEGDMISMPLYILISFRSRSPEMMMVAPASSASDTNLSSSGSRLIRSSATASKN